MAMKTLTTMKNPTTVKIRNTRKGPRVHCMVIIDNAVCEEPEDGIFIRVLGKAVILGDDANLERAELAPSKQAERR